MTTIPRSFLTLNLLILSFMFLEGRHGASLVLRNWSTVTVTQSWLNLKNPNFYGNEITDGIPDQWLASNWGNSRATFGIETNAQQHESNSFVITKNNHDDGAVLSQTFEVNATNAIACRAIYSGTQAFIQLLGGEINISQHFPESKAPREIHVTSPTGASTGQLTLFLGIFGNAGRVQFARPFCFDIHSPSVNLLKNSEFAADGRNIDPIVWWQKFLNDATDANQSEVEFARQSLIQQTDTYPTTIVYLAMADLLLGSTQDVVKRLQAHQDDCQHGWIPPLPQLALSLQIEESNGLQAREKVTQLAQSLMPNCPQPYWALAQLYATQGAPSRAADYFEKARLAASSNALKAWYAFHEASLRIKNTGEWGRGMEVLATTSQSANAAMTPWHRGELLMLWLDAQVLAGDCKAARVTLEQLAACEECTEHLALISSKISQLKKCRDTQEQ